MSDVNMTTLTGRLVRDPMLRRTSNGMGMAFVTIASNHSYKDKSGIKQEEVAFVTCKAFGGWADPLANCHKGDKLVVGGRLRTETWVKDDARESQLFLICDSLHVVSGRNGNGASSTGAGSQPREEMPAAVKNAVPF